MRGLRVAVVLCIGCIGVAVAQRTEHLSPGTVIPKVICAANPQQSYALYLPSQFSPSKRWPIIYAFDPAARGQLAVETIRAAAEKYGYIVVGSNNSHNGAEAASTESMRAIWHDTEQRLPIDEHRRYFAGMSGGARLVTALALECNGCVAGVIANAAGFPVGRKPSPSMKFVYFAAFGNADFNFSEFVELRRQLEQSAVPYRIREFEGQHGWAPPEVWLDALDWMDLQAMRAGFVGRDPERIQRSYSAAIERASRLLSGKDLLAAYREYKFAVRDFSGLIDVSAAEKAVAELGRDKRLKSAEKEETSAGDAQSRLISGPSSQIQELASGNPSPSDLMALRDDLAMLRRQTGGSSGTSDPRALIARRALSGLMIQAFESGEYSMSQKKYELALHLFDLVVVASENPGWAHYHRARAYAAMSDKKHMLAELKAAYSSGFRDSSALSAPEFQVFQNQPEFQEIVREWSANPQ